MYSRPAGAAAPTDILYAAERATSLRSKDWSPAGVVVHSVTPGPGVDRETVTIRSTYPMTEAGKEFLRLSVTLTP